MRESEPLQQANRTFVQHRGKILSYFGGCDYFRLASHPAVHQAIRDGLKTYGLNVSASRLTSGNHVLFQQLERSLCQFFNADAALLTSGGYATNLILAQTLAGQFSHALLDERAHVSLQDAAQLLNCPVLKFKHRDAEDLSKSLQRCGKNAKPIVLTDGMFSHSGAVAPLKSYLKILPKDGLLVVDDAHGGGTVGRTGKGAVEVENVPRMRVVQNVTLSKSFGVYGGAILCSRNLREKIVRSSRMFGGTTPLPLPLAAGALKAIQILRTDTSLRTRLVRNANHVKTELRKIGIALPDEPGPIVSIVPANSTATARINRSLLKQKILPPFVKYPGGPAAGYFRFVISSEHTRAQLDALVHALTEVKNVY